MENNIRLKLKIKNKYNLFKYNIIKIFLLDYNVNIHLLN